MALEASVRPAEGRGESARETSVPVVLGNLKSVRAGLLPRPRRARAQNDRGDGQGHDRDDPGERAPHEGFHDASPTPLAHGSLSDGAWGKGEYRRSRTESMSYRNAAISHSEGTRATGSPRARR